MADKFLIKNFSQTNIDFELTSIKFDKSYLQTAKNKYENFLLKIYNLTPTQATILKQTALSAGTDCAVDKDVLTHNTDKTDCILFCTKKQLKEIIKKLHRQPFNLKTLANNLNSFSEKILIPYDIRNNIFDWRKTYIMGILNFTPNSFSDGGEFFEAQKGVTHFEKLITDGADIIDIGAESTAPNSTKISIEEEILRIEKILTLCRQKNHNIPISIDTRNAAAAQKAIELGADIINDISGLSHDPNMINVAYNSKAYLILTFNKIIYQNTLDETIKGLIALTEKAIEYGIKEEKIILDVGLGFNKTFEQNFELIKNANEICSIGLPVLYGLSRKSFVQKSVNLPSKETEFANVSLSSYLISKGVNILRVHDVYNHKIAFKALDKVIYD